MGVSAASTHASAASTHGCSTASRVCACRRDSACRAIVRHSVVRTRCADAIAASTSTTTTTTTAATAVTDAAAEGVQWRGGGRQQALSLQEGTPQPQGGLVAGQVQVLHEGEDARDHAGDCALQEAAARK